MSKTRRAFTEAEKMIKVDHAGENGAVNIYRGQRVIAKLFHPNLVANLIEFQKHEEQHREIFRHYLDSKNIRRCISYHACGLGGLILGLATGILGRKAIAATTYAVEHVVLRHLAEQISWLRQSDPAALSCVSRIFEDEKSHYDSAELQLGKLDRLTRSLIFIVKFSTESVIRFGMR